MFKLPMKVDVGISKSSKKVWFYILGVQVSL